MRHAFTLLPVLLGVILLVKLSLFPSSNTASHSHEYLLCMPSLMSVFFLALYRMQTKVVVQPWKLLFQTIDLRSSGYGERWGNFTIKCPPALSPFCKKDPIFLSPSRPHLSFPDALSSRPSLLRSRQPKEERPGRRSAPERSRPLARAPRGGAAPCARPLHRPAHVGRRLSCAASPPPGGRRRKRPVGAPSEEEPPPCALALRRLTHADRSQAAPRWATATRLSFNCTPTSRSITRLLRAGPRGPPPPRLPRPG
jgi:hypothetical protein